MLPLGYKLVMKEGLKLSVDGHGVKGLGIKITGKALKTDTLVLMHIMKWCTVAYRAELSASLWIYHAFQTISLKPD